MERVDLAGEASGSALATDGAAVVGPPPPSIGGKGNSSRPERTPAGRPAARCQWSAGAVQGSGSTHYRLESGWTLWGRVVPLGGAAAGGAAHLKGLHCGRDGLVARRRRDGGGSGRCPSSCVAVGRLPTGPGSGGMIKLARPERGTAGSRSERPSMLQRHRMRAVARTAAGGASAAAPLGAYAAAPVAPVTAAL